MKATLLLVALLGFVVLASCNVAGLRGSFRHCDAQTGDETTAVFGDDDEDVSLLYIRGGCLGADEFELRSTVRLIFETSNPSTGGVYNVRQEFRSSNAVPLTDDGLAALRTTCPGLVFTKNQETDVTTCKAFYPCLTYYDILSVANNGNAFYLGDGKTGACTAETRPTRLESSEYTRVELRIFAGASSLIVPLVLLASLAVFLF